MKVGILTCHSGLNYGANLQLYANVKTLERMGHEVFVYDNRDYPAGPCRDFVSTHMQLTRECRSDEDFRAETLRLGIETVIVGSDAVLWFLPHKKEGHGAYPNPFWLRWAEGLPVRKALVAGSCMGVMFLKVRGVLRRELCRDLSAFDYIAVRDRWTLMFLRWVGVRKADLVFDPTSCLPDLFQPEKRDLPAELQDARYLLLTFSGDENMTTWVEDLAGKARSAGLKTCFIPHPDRLCEVEGVDVSIMEPLDPLIWLSILGNATAYIGERFHPIVLSAFYRIPFWACDYYSRSGLHGLISGRSKTKDFCARIGASKQLAPSDTFFERNTPESILQAISGKRALSSPADPAGFRSVLEKAIGK